MPTNWRGGIFCGSRNIVTIPPAACASEVATPAPSPSHPCIVQVRWKQLSKCTACRELFNGCVEMVRGPRPVLEIRGDDAEHALH